MCRRSQGLCPRKQGFLRSGCRSFLRRPKNRSARSGRIWSGRSADPRFRRMFRPLDCPVAVTTCTPFRGNTTPLTCSPDRPRGHHDDCEAPRVDNPGRVRGGAIRACRESRRSHRRKSRDSCECLARRTSRHTNLHRRTRWKVADLDHKIRAGQPKTIAGPSGS